MVLLNSGVSRDISFHVALRAGPFRASGAGEGRGGGRAGSVSIPSHAITFFCPKRKRLPRRRRRGRPALPGPARAARPARDAHKRTGALLRTWRPRPGRCWVSPPDPAAAAGCSCLLPPAGAACRGGAGHGCCESGSCRKLWRCRAGRDAGRAGGRQGASAGRSGAGAWLGRFRRGTGTAAGPRTLVLHLRGRAGRQEGDAPASRDGTPVLPTASPCAPGGSGHRSSV